MTANKELKDTVLIVDDEQAFLDLLSFNLSEAGMKVETAQTAADAMKAVALVRNGCGVSPAWLRWLALLSSGLS